MDKVWEIVVTALLILVIGIPLLVLLIYVTIATFRLLYQGIKKLFSGNIDNREENQQSWMDGYRERNKL